MTDLTFYHTCNLTIPTVVSEKIAKLIQPAFSQGGGRDCLSSCFDLEPGGITISKITLPHIEKLLLCLFSLFLLSISLCPILLTRTKAVFLCPPSALDED